ncbi:DUF3800 domain-containing protein [Xanthomonas campestris]|uniref:DUF3800 domain-containing protein n=1 Tax=Xanthomonas campestris TaxID=339 RepID=UPI002B233113|nr:DUF3800 domain-containing protein [Xanthomonas campestris]MEB1025489.1 DUF3800 domain-containing protein [Xanthomonas campestris pv. campestris]MEA9550782.1 DUF3800 domain-containing protein [Xanthomonas campestris]MEB1134158.1 DUF3800 domain-containing protein [Xanthomonas campestris pv. campestris]MEB1654053.1 DUF3800 domain-containing protein [Xanthomonas campestris pv. campestris]MEB1862588.1 DUF3800 domain-containing protein [Xanthomonas campestris pv. campestris]
MYICYLDESGTVEATDPSCNHFVLVGLAILASAWKAKDTQIDEIKSRYGLASSEIHTAWMLKDYQEQKVIPNFEDLDYSERKRLAIAQRTQNLARSRKSKAQKSLIINYKKTEAYLHLTRSERSACINELADLIGSWQDARIFADAQKKASLPSCSGDFEEAFEQVVTRFNTCLNNVGGVYGLIVQDNNQTVARRLTEQMRKFHRQGTTWAKNIQFVVETPMFVDSELTSMVQLADLCGYAIRRFFDKQEEELLNRISPIFDRNGEKLVGVRHYTKAESCVCRICLEHGRRAAR